jgi:signal transduction histidine kinase
VINPDVISNLNLIEAIKLEVDRFNRLKFIAAELKIVGDIFEIDARKEIILFRMLQEFFINTLKHAQATLITIDIEFVIDCLYIKVKDNGKGFDQSESSDGIGLMNMKNRAHLIDAEFSLHSKLNEGTILTLQLNKKP